MKILILGAGQVGSSAAYHLSREEANEVTVVDMRPDVLRELQDRLDIRTVVGHAAHPEVLDTPAPVALFQGFGASSLDFQLRTWVATFEHWFVVQSDLCVAINAALAKANIEIPFPQRDLHLRSVDTPAREALADLRPPPPTAD